MPKIVFFVKVVTNQLLFTPHFIQEGQQSIRDENIVHV